MKIAKMYYLFILLISIIEEKHSIYIYMGTQIVMYLNYVSEEQKSSSKSVSHSMGVFGSKHSKKIIR